MAEHTIDKFEFNSDVYNLQDNISGYITSPNIPYCTCDTAAATAAKTTTLVSGSFTENNLVTGAQVLVKFTNANGKASPTLSVNGTTAKAIMRYGTTAPSTSASGSWNAGSVILFTYDGTYWQMQGWLNTNTTYSEASVAEITSASSSTARLISGRRAASAVAAFESITDVTVDGTSVVSNKVAAITMPTVPTKTSDLNNDSGFITAASPALTGTPTAPTATTGDSSTQIATTAFVQDAMSAAGAGTVTSVGVSNATNGGLSVSGSPISSSGTITIGHSNILTNAQTTQAVYPIKIDKNGHISSYGSAVTIPSITLNGSSTTSPSFYAPTSVGTSGYYLKSNGSGAPSWVSFPTIPSITLNGSSTTSPSFYAPTSAGTSGYVLKSSGSGAPTWSSETPGAQIIRWTES